MRLFRYGCGILLATAWVLGSAKEPSGSDLLRAPLVVLDGQEAYPPAAKVALGMSRGIVLQQLGEPTLQFTRDLWVYRDFRGRNLAREEPGDALIVAFARDRVSVIRITDAKAVTELLTRRKRAEEAAKIAAR